MSTPYISPTSPRRCRGRGSGRSARTGSPRRARGRPRPARTSGTASAGPGRGRPARTPPGRCRWPSRPPGPCRSRGRTAGSGWRPRSPATPNAIDAPRQPTAAISGAPMTATTTVPTLPPAMWALIAKPAALRRELLGQQAVADRVLGEPPTRDTMFGIANVAKLVANAWSANPPPNRNPPTRACGVARRSG